MNYEETLDFLYRQLPMYQRIGKAAYKANLDTTIALLDALDNPQKKFKSVHLAGTNGKGSCSHMLAAVFQENGYKTGLYTSPHLIDFRERIRIDGGMIEQNYVRDFVDRIQDSIVNLQPSFFELTVAMAFSYFAEQKVDIAIIETGLGGRLDSTNLINPELSIITNIGLDHMQFLGNTKEKIAKEKAGIIKENTPVVVGRKGELATVFQAAASAKNAKLFFAEDEKLAKYESDLLGSYQNENLNTIALSLKLLAQIGWELDDIKTRRALKNVAHLTGFAGRYQLLNNEPKVICDTAHNEDGLVAVMEQIQHERFTTLRMVMGFVDDKNIDDLIELLPRKAEYYFCRASIPRSLAVDVLQEKMHSKGIVGRPFPDVESAYHQAMNEADHSDMIFVGGSTFVVADLLASINPRQ